MLTKAIVLILVGVLHPGSNPTAAPAGSYATIEDCTQAAQALQAAALLNNRMVTGFCLVTPYSFIDKGARGWKTTANAR